MISLPKQISELRIHPATIKRHSLVVKPPQQLPLFCQTRVRIIEYHRQALVFMASLMWDIGERLRKPEELNLDFVLSTGT